MRVGCPAAGSVLEQSGAGSCGNARSLMARSACGEIYVVSTSMSEPESDHSGVDSGVMRLNRGGRLSVCAVICLADSEGQVAAANRRRAWSRRPVHVPRSGAVRMASISFSVSKVTIVRSQHLAGMASTCWIVSAFSGWCSAVPVRGDRQIPLPSGGD
jgi:hypothetical protein